MEDSPLRTVPHNEAQELKDVGDKKRPPGRQSAVSAQVRPVDVMNEATLLYFNTMTVKHHNPFTI